LHAGNVGAQALRRVSQHGGIVQIAAGGVYQTRRWPNCALFATLDGASLVLFPIRYEDTPTEVWTVDPSVFFGPAITPVGWICTGAIRRRRTYRRRLHLINCPSRSRGFVETSRRVAGSQWLSARTS
jgi:hypothetical protein